MFEVQDFAVWLSQVGLVYVCVCVHANLQDPVSNLELATSSCSSTGGHLQGVEQWGE